MKTPPSVIRSIRILVILLVGIVVGGLVIVVAVPYQGNHSSEYTLGDYAREYYFKIKYRLPWVRQPSSGCSCIAYLKQIDGAKATWALENKKTNSDVPTASDLFGPTAYIRDTPQCPGGGTYTLNAVVLTPTCSLAYLGHTL